jgi:hypothetical protein
MRLDNALSKSMQYPRQQKSFSVKVKRNEKGKKREKRERLDLIGFSTCLK